MSLIKVLREQSAIGFNGRVIQREVSLGQQVGVILVYSGVLVGCEFNGKVGKKALLNLLIKDFSTNGKYDSVVEPEVISADSFQFDLSVEDIELDLKSLIEESERNKNLKPPGNKRVMINADFICRGENISAIEFDLMCTISDYGKIEDIYQNSDLLDFEVTNGLISLRKKAGLKVIS